MLHLFFCLFGFLLGWLSSPSFSPHSFVRPETWDDSQVGVRGSNASGGPIVLLPGAFWEHGASKMAILDASLLLCVLQCFRA